MNPRECRALQILLAAFIVCASGSRCFALAQSATNARPQSIQVTELANDLATFRRSGRGERNPLRLENGVRDSAFGAALLARARLVDTVSLTHQEQLTLGVVRWEAWKLEQTPYLFWYNFSIFPSTSPLQALRSRAQGQQVRTRADVDTYLRLLDESGNTIDAMLAKLKAQAARMIIMPRGALDLAAPYVRSFGTPGSDHAFAVTAERLAGLPAEQRDSAQATITQRIETVVVTKANALADYVDRELRPRAPTAVGLWQYPGGKEAYRRLVQIEVSIPGITPEQIFRNGIRDVKELDAEMKKVRTSLGFRGTKLAFDKQLSGDPRFYVKTPAEMADRYMAHLRRIEPIIPKFFLQVPDVAYKVQRLDPLVEPTQTFGFTGGDTYFFNGSNLDQRSTIDGAALIYHELLPGHAYQGAVSRAMRGNDSLPLLRRMVAYPGLSEGWGEYASSVVAREAGMYADPYDLYGRLGFDMFFAVRLVVDPGMAYFGWSRERAMTFMREHALTSALQTESETWRYSARTPGQVVAYRTGRQVVLGLRQRAERELGKRFDIRRFHEAMIGSGALPLFLLERHIKWWIAQEKMGPTR